VAGERAVGHTTVMNALAHFVPAGERLALIEDARELTVPQDNALRLDKGALAAVGESFLDIVPQLLADRVFIDPISAEDVVEFIGLALDGHDGMIATVRGRSAETVLRRMSLAVELAVGAPLGERARDMVAEAVDLIVVVDRVDGGIVIREIVSVDDAGQFGFRTSEILANS
jgi:pilus assembly protein CpaF